MNTGCNVWKCKKQATHHVRTLGYPGWIGHYCSEHALTVSSKTLAVRVPLRRSA